MRKQAAQSLYFALLCSVYGFMPAVSCAQTVYLQPITSNIQPPSNSTTDLVDNYRIAASLYEREQWLEAKNEFLALIANYPESAQAIVAQFYLGECYLQLKETTSARAAYQSFILTADKHTLLDEATFRVAELAFKAGDASTANLLEGYLAAYPHSQWREYALHYLGQCRLQKDEFGLARSVFETVLREYPEGGLADANRLALAMALEHTGETDQARRFLQHSVANACEPFRTFAEIRLAIFEARESPQNKQIAELEKSLSQIPENDPILAEGWFILGRAYFSQEKFNAALKAFEAVADCGASPKLQAIALHDQAMTLSRLERKQDAADRLDSLALLHPDSELIQQALPTRARLAFASADFPKVKLLAKQANAKNKKELGELSARAAFELGEFAGAAQEFQSLIDTYLDSSERSTWMYLQGLAALNLADYQMAKQSLLALDEDQLPDSYRMAFQIALGTSLQGTENWSEAERAFRSVLNSSDSHEQTIAKENVLTCLLHQNKIEEAIKFYESLPASSHEQFRAETLLSLADNAVALNQYPFASKVYDLVVDITADRSLAARALANTGWVAMRMDDSSKAEMYFRQVVTNFRDYDQQSDIWIALAKIAELKAQWTEAAKCYLQAAEESKDSETIAICQLKQAVALRKIGGPREIQRAQQILQLLIQETHETLPRDLALYELSWVEQALGRSRQSRLLLEEIVGNYPDSTVWPDAAFRVAQRLISENDDETAAGLLSKIQTRTESPDLLVRARFLEAQIDSHKQNWGAVAEKMAAIAADPVDPNLNQRAKYWQAESLYQLMRFEEALTLFQSLDVATFPDASLGPWIVLRMGQCSVHLEKWSIAKNYVYRGKREFKGFAFEYEFEFILARVYFAAGELNEAMKLFEHILQTPAAKATETAAQAQWRIGEVLFLQEKYTEAIRAYYRVESLYSYPYWQAAALLQAGKCQERLKNYSQAIILYGNLLKKYPTSEFAKTARQRLSSLDRQVNEKKTENHVYR